MATQILQLQRRGGGMRGLIDGFRGLLGGNGSGAPAKLAALNTSLSTIEFAPDGTILDANANFLALVGYQRDDIRGRHHSIFVDPGCRNDDAYLSFWQSLRNGEFQAGEYKRIARGGREVWIQATYTPILGRLGRPVRIMKCAMDVTAMKNLNADYSGQIDALHKSQGVIQFAMDGTILDANSRFLEAVGYSSAELVGKHHSMFVDPAEVASWDYANFWQKLREGQFQRARFRRAGKGGRPVWLEASYNPIYDLNNKPYKIVKYATDITAETLRATAFAGEIEAINRAQCVVHFDMEGRVLEANANFLDAFGYTPGEVVGRHHEMFVELNHARSRDYHDFWQRLRRGEFHCASYKRLGKQGREIFIQATYNPIKDADGRPFKVVKYATDITEEVRTRRIAVEAAHQAANKVQLVAEAARSMSAAFNTINLDMGESRRTVDVMHGHAMAADRHTGDLRQATEAMDDVAQFINRIAEQINLLALNATIEASRAGEAGRGFATVAGEVKTLANKASAATSKISEQIRAMQGVSAEVVGSIADISDTIALVQSLVTRASTAMSEQNGTTQEISSNMNAAASAVADISRTLTA